MTVPPGFKSAAQSLTGMVMEMLPKWRNRVSADEAALAVYLRGNAPLFEALTQLIKSRIAGRAAVAEPTDPLICKSMLARDRELQWLLARLEFIYRSPAFQAIDDEREQPA